MAKKSSSQLIIDVLVKPMTTAEILLALPEGMRATAPQLICSLAKGERLNRIGTERPFAYEVNPNWSRKPMGGKRTGAGRKSQARPECEATCARFDDAENFGGAPEPMAASKLLPPSLGSVCAPPNAAAGRIEDAIAAVLGNRLELRLNDLLDLMPIGWSRAQTVAALTEGVHDGWIGSERNNGIAAYTLLGKPPAPRADPLATKFAHQAVQQRIDAIEKDIDDLIHDVREQRFMGSLGNVLSDARSSIRRASTIHQADEIKARA